MCGIVGYVGPQQALPILLRNLNLLTYRGYDSAGVAVTYDNTFYIAKKAGKVPDLEAYIGDVSQVQGTIGIGHTRWATHGLPTDINAHPHTDCKQQISLVHNGIIENYYTLKQELLAKGHVIVSETDTEVLAHLIEDYYQGDPPRRCARPCSGCAVRWPSSSSAATTRTKSSPPSWIRRR